MTNAVGAALALTPSTFTVVILEDMQEAAKNLKNELHKRKVSAHLCKSIGELITHASTMMAAMFAVDLDMGEGRRQEGLDAVKELRKLSRNKRRSFYIAALTSHSELQEEASQAGVDAFIVKSSARTDALELLTRLSAHTIEVEKMWADPIQTELAKREYSNLARQLKTVRTLNHGLRLSSAIATIQRALNWPFLLPNEQLVLSTLDEQLRAAHERGDIDEETLKICIEGVEIIAKDRSLDRPISEWIQRAHLRSSDFIFSWLDNEDLDNE
jgi:ActR/RegA family two-component response regulator